MKPKASDLKISVAGICTLIRFNDKSYFEYFVNFFKDFIADERPEAFIEVFQKASKDNSNRIIIVSPQKLIPVNKTFKEKSPIYIKSINKVIQFKSKNLVGKFDLNKRKGDFTISQKIAFRPLLRLLYSLLLIEKKAILLHSSAIKTKKKCFVFSGPSGVGKSTVAAFSEQPPLNEDMNVLKLKGDKVIVCSTPFAGFFHTKKIELPLDKLFFIKKSNKTVLEKIKPEKTVIGLMENSVNVKEIPEIIKKLFNLTHKLCKYIDAYKLEFEKNRKFWKKIKELA